MLYHIILQLKPRVNAVHGNLKNMGALINELRRKVNHTINASFVINGQLIKDRRQIYNEFYILVASVAKN